METGRPRPSHRSELDPDFLSDKSQPAILPAGEANEHPLSRVPLQAQEYRLAAVSVCDQVSGSSSESHSLAIGSA